MMKLIDNLLDQAETRILVSSLVALVGMTFLAAYLYLFKAPVSEYKKLDSQVERSRLDRDRQMKTDVQALLATTQKEVADYREHLYGAGEQVSSNEMIPFIIGRLDKLSRGLDIQLMSVRPGHIGRVLMFDEVAFDVSVSGSYLDLVNWLQSVEGELHPMVVKQFEMLNGQSDNELLTRMKIVSYRPGQGAI